MSTPSVPYIYGRIGTNNIVGAPLETTTLGRNIRIVYTLMSIPKGPYIYGQSGTNGIVGDTARHYHYGRVYKDRVHININTKRFIY